MKKVIDTWRKYGLSGLARKTFRKFVPSEYQRNVPISGFNKFKTLFQQKTGIEIGGPSGIFAKHIPLYDLVAKLDGCNFSNNTVWEGSLKEGNTFKYGENTGYQFLDEASELKKIEDEKYDFLISSNCLEHIANPLKAVKEWLRVIKKNGAILLILPNKAYCFDHRRKYTSFNHLMNDFENNTDEHDLTHLDEILELHDLSLDIPAGTFEQFKERSLKNYENRCLHHHVFNTALLKEIFRFFNVDVLYTKGAENFIILGKKKS